MADEQGAPPPAGDAPAAAPAEKSNQTLMIVIVVVVGLVAIVVAALFFLSDDDGEDATTTAPPAATGETPVLREPIDSATDPFAPAGQIGTDLPVTPVTTEAPTTVEGGRVGLYGGTLNSAHCDKEQLKTFLAENATQATAWAAAVGVAPGDVGAYIDRLTPVLLRSDTSVTNHGFKDGQAIPVQSVLQAGTAVLVDDKGLPVTKCYCGNPLKPPVFTPPPTTVTTEATTTTATPPTYYEYPPVYSGPEWPGFTPTSITIINVNITVIEVFILVDPETGETFERPAGSDGSQDTSSDEPVPAPPTPDPTTSTTATDTTTTTTNNTTTTNTTTTTTFNTTTTQARLPDEPCVDENNNIVPCN